MKRITKIGEHFYVYRDGDYLGRDLTFKEAEMRNFKSETCLKDELPSGLPAFLALTSEESKASWANVPIKTTWSFGMPKSNNYEGMTPDALLRAYNEQVEVARSKGLEQYKPLTRFEDEETAKKHLEQIESSIRASVEASKAEAAPQRKKEPTKAELRTEGVKAVKTFNSRKKKEAKEQKAAEKAEKAAAKAKEVPAPKQQKAVGKSADFIEAAGLREGTNKAALASLLVKNINKSIPLAEVCKHVYGKGSNPAITNVIGGLIINIKEKGLKYEIKKDKENVGLYTSK